MGNQLSHPFHHIGQPHALAAEGKEIAKKYFRKGNEKFNSNELNAASIQYRKALDTLKSAGSRGHYTATALRFVYTTHGN